MSTIIGYNRDGVAISDKSNLVGKEICIPLRKNGEMISYISISVTDLDMEYEFTENLVFNDIWKGRSAIHFVYSDRSGRQFYMFRKDFVELVKHNDGVISPLIGRFKFNKKGANIGIVYLGEK